MLCCKLESLWSLAWIPSQGKLICLSVLCGFVVSVQWWCLSLQYLFVISCRNTFCLASYPYPSLTDWGSRNQESQRKPLWSLFRHGRGIVYRWPTFEAYRAAQWFGSVSAIRHPDMNLALFFFFFLAMTHLNVN